MHSTFRLLRDRRIRPVKSISDNDLPYHLSYLRHMSLSISSVLRYRSDLNFSISCMSSLQNSNINVITQYIAISVPNIFFLSKAGLLSQLNLKGTDELRFLLQLVRIRNSSPMPTLCNFESLSLVNCI